MSVIVYLGVDYSTAQALLNGYWPKQTTFLCSTITHAIKKARKITANNELAVVVEVFYKTNAQLRFNTHKCGYHTRRKPNSVRIKWVSVNGGFIQFNYPV